MPIDLSQVSIVSPLLVESDDRRRNLERFLDYYAAIGEGVEIVLAEQRVRADAPVCSFDGLRFVRHLVLEGPEVHWTTRNRNAAARLSTRPYLGIIDVDVLVVPEAFEEAIARMAEGSAFVQLFNGVLVDVDEAYQARHPAWDDFLAQRVFFERDHDQRPPPPAVGMTPLYGNSHYAADGGATACTREAFFRIGGFNENFVSYGFEEVEIVHRIEKLGFDFERLPRFNAYHLHHDRGSDSHYNQFYRLNEAEYERVRAMDRAALQAYADQGFRALELRHDAEYEFSNARDEVAWRRIETGRSSLEDLCIVVTADDSVTEYFHSALPSLLELLEERFRFAEIRIHERGAGAFEPVDRRGNVLHRGYPADAAASELLADAARDTKRPWILPVPLTRDASGDFLRAERVLQRLRGPRRPVEGIEAREAFLRAPAATPAPAPATEGAHPPAVYLAFDDGFLPMAGACLASLEKNWPDHPTVLVDYVGEHPAVREWIDSQSGLQPAPPVEPPVFARSLGGGPVGSRMVQRRFGLWTDAFDAFGPILHLDADTLVLGPLSELVASDAWTILPNHEDLLHVRVFDPIFEHDLELGALLSEDGLAYPHGVDDMANAGVFLLPRSLRDREQLTLLERIVGRYGRYLGFADQSVISLWCRMLGMPYSRDWRYNYQAVFVTDPSVELRLDEARVLHFSGRQKPGSEAFLAWERLRPHAPQLDRIHREYLEISELARIAGRAA